MESIRCFLFERINVRSATMPGCDRNHGDDDPCNDNGYEAEVADVRRLDTGEIIGEGVQEWWYPPAGAMFFEEWTEPNRPTGPDDWDHPDLVKPSPDAKRAPSHTFADGPQLIVMCPSKADGTGRMKWNVDSRASNCSMPYDYEHRCWVRTGEPPNVTAGKDGPTCSAGAGSIQAHEWHGFLLNGELAP